MKLSKAQKMRLQTIGRKYKLKLVLLFGSAATGKMHACSDIDIAVQTEDPSKGFGIYLDLLHEFEAVFPEKKIDLSFTGRADPLFLAMMCKQPRCLYGKKLDLAKLKLLSYKKYIDYQPYLAIESKFVDRFVKELYYGVEQKVN